jgi:radical SAM superfamily enzyme YgiQ (UPF0313 family)
MPYCRMLFVYPEFEPSYWGMQYSLPIAQRKALMPPLGLLTIAAMTPESYELRVVDENTTQLTDADIEWADIVLFSAMLVQKPALFKSAARCRRAGKLVVFGGPYPTACAAEARPHCDVLVLNEGEVTWPMFLKDLAAGTPGKVYASDDKPDMTDTPCPRFDLIDPSDYVLVPIQFSRGCPFQCEFCDIIVLFGRRPRTKTPEQMLRELDALLSTGYRGRVFIVDDNFIGNKRDVFKFLPELIRWNREHGTPFSYGTEATVNLADDAKLLNLMVEAGFVTVFLGIETPSAESLKETRKYQNATGSLLDRVLTIQRAGLSVYGGFIVGFDNDSEDIFDRQIEFITESAIANAMVGPLMALPGTPLYEKLRRENRLLERSDYESWYESGCTNVITKIPRPTLLRGYRRIMETIYDPARFFDRTLRGLQRLPRRRSYRDRARYFWWLVKAELGRSQPVSAEKPSLRKLYRSFPPAFRKHVKRFFWRVLRSCPEQLPLTLSFILMGYHSYRFTVEYTLPQIDRALAEGDASLLVPVSDPALGQIVG